MILAVIGSAIWFVVADGRSSDEPGVPREGAASEESDAVAWIPAGRTAYLWDPSNGEVNVVHHVQGQLSD